MESLPSLWMCGGPARCRFAWSNKFNYYLFYRDAQLGDNYFLTQCLITTIAYIICFPKTHRCSRFLHIFQNYISSFCYFCVSPFRFQFELVGGKKEKVRGADALRLAVVIVLSFWISFPLSYCLQPTPPTSTCRPWRYGTKWSTREQMTYISESNWHRHLMQHQAYDSRVLLQIPFSISYNDEYMIRNQSSDWKMCFVFRSRVGFWYVLYSLYLFS